MMKKVVKGEFYKHYKGGIYEIIGEGLHTESKEYLVFYKNINDERLWARPFRMFKEDVVIDGVTIKRFQKIEKAD